MPLLTDSEGASVHKFMKQFVLKIVYMSKAVLYCTHFCFTLQLVHAVKCKCFNINI